MRNDVETTIFPISSGSALRPICFFVAIVFWMLNPSPPIAADSKPGDVPRVKQLEWIDDHVATIAFGNLGATTVRFKVPAGSFLRLFDPVNGENENQPFYDGYQWMFIPEWFEYIVAPGDMVEHELLLYSTDIALHHPSDAEAFSSDTPPYRIEMPAARKDIHDAATSVYAAWRDLRQSGKLQLLTGGERLAHGILQWSIWIATGTIGSTPVTGEALREVVEGSLEPLIEPGNSQVDAIVPLIGNTIARILETASHGPLPAWLAEFEHAKVPIGELPFSLEYVNLFYAKEQAQFCTCESIELRYANGERARKPLKFPSDKKKLTGKAADRALGENAHIATKGPLRDDVLRARLNFEIKAVLKENSKPELCPEHQKVNATMKLRGTNLVVKEVRTDAQGRKFGKLMEQPAGVTGNQWYPFTGNRLILDNHGYVKPLSDKKSALKVYYEKGKKPQIRWIDSPGVSKVSKIWFDGGPDDGFKLQAAFEAVVDVCKCTWEVHIEISKIGVWLTRPTVANLVCTPAP